MVGNGFTVSFILAVLTLQLWAMDEPVAAAVKLATLSVHMAASTGWMVKAMGWLTVTITVLDGEVQAATVVLKPTLLINPRGVNVGVAGAGNYGTTARSKGIGTSCNRTVSKVKSAI